MNFVLHDHEKFSNHHIDYNEANTFIEKLEATELTDLGYIECPFTWTNRRTGDQLTEKRLDRGLATESWFEIHHNSTISNLPTIGSDHNPIILNTNSFWKQGHIPFKFFGSWLDHKDCKEIIAECWKNEQKGSLAIKIARKLRDVKIKLKKWNKEIYGNIKTNLEDSIKHLEWITKNIFNSTIGQAIREAKKKVEHWQDIQEKFWKTKSRDQLIKLGDKNTSFFHISAKKRYRRNKIVSIQNEEGTWLHNINEIHLFFNNHFSNMATAELITINQSLIELIPTTITNNENIHLLRTHDAWEIKNTLFSMAGDKAPGPNGFLPNFFQAKREVVGSDIINMVQNFFTSGFILKEMNSTFISLIPKIEILPSQLTSCLFLYAIPPIKSYPNFLLKDSNLSFQNLFHPFSLLSSMEDKYLTILSFPMRLYII
ncbi:uncharacterized protein LOC113339650 [Papaver somniferum]|uniref:uncharacterized protein LOC113339650 n=1 Tax=Papaver somniferum TaxID=3469 RepID=UPI000E7042AA|nr:uncharacterized protein LOC113339650 [Papaver somniferum]